jgi:hypothetical protein
MTFVKTDSKNAPGQLWRRIILGALILIFVVLWGGGGLFNQNASNLYVVAGKVNVRTDDFVKRLRPVLENIKNSNGTITQEQKLQAAYSVLNELINAALVELELSALGIDFRSISDDEAILLIKNDDMFISKNGVFDREYFLRYINHVGKTEKMYIDDVKKNRLSNILLFALLGSSTSPHDTFVQILMKGFLQKRECEYSVIKYKDMQTENVTEDSLKIYFEQNSAKFVTKSGRKFRLVRLPNDSETISQISEYLDQQYSDLSSVAEKFNLIVSAECFVFEDNTLPYNKRLNLAGQNDIDPNVLSELVDSILNTEAISVPLLVLCKSQAFLLQVDELVLEKNMTYEQAKDLVALAYKEEMQKKSAMNEAEKMSKEASFVGKTRLALELPYSDKTDDEIARSIRSVLFGMKINEARFSKIEDGYVILKMLSLTHLDSVKYSSAYINRVRKIMSSSLVEISFNTLYSLLRIKHAFYDSSIKNDLVKSIISAV